MSGKMFKGKMGNGTVDKSATYKSAEHPYDLKLVNRLVQQCECLGTMNSREKITSFVRKNVLEKAESVEDFDHKAFLEAIIAACAVDSDVDNINLRLDLLISVSMQALYDAGIEEFNIDFSHLPKHEDYFVVCEVKGTEKKPLKLTTTGDVRRLGSTMHYCELEVAEGSVQSAGTHSESSVFRLDGPKTEVVSVGSWATGSDYYVKDIKPVLGSLMKLPLDGITDYELYQASSKKCRFYVRNGAGGEALEQLKEAGFFDKLNRVLIPDGPDRWKEVRP